MAARQVDYVVLVTPTVMRKATYREEGTCLDPKLPGGYLADPRHR